MCARVRGARRDVSTDGQLHASAHYGALSSPQVRAETFLRMGDMQRAYVDLRTALQARPEWTVLHALHARFLLVANKIQPAVRECWSLAQSWMALRRPPLVIASPPPKSQAHAKGKPPAKGTDKLPDKPSDIGTDKGGASAAPPDGGTAGVDKSSGGEKATGGAAKAGGAGAGGRFNTASAGAWTHCESGSLERKPHLDQRALMPSSPLSLPPPNMGACVAATGRSVT